MDTSNDNIRKLFDMLDNLEAYSEQEISDIINCDEEIQETYRLMVEAKRSSRWKQPGQPRDVDAAWQRFQQTHSPLSREEESLADARKLRAATPSPSREGYPKGRVGLHSSFHKIAAIFLAVVFLGALAWAIGPLFLSSKLETNQPAQVTAPSLQGRAGGESSVRFDNIRLDSILSVVSTHYGKAVSFRSDEAKAMKFIMMWVPDSSLSSFIDGLNMFDGLQLTLLRDTIFVETTEVKEDAE